MEFTNEQHFLDFPCMMIKCSRCNKVLFKDNEKQQLNDNKSIHNYLVNQCDKRQIHFCCNCGKKLVIPNEVEYGKYTYGLGNGIEINQIKN